MPIHKANNRRVVVSATAYKVHRRRYDADNGSYPVAQYTYPFTRSFT